MTTDRPAVEACLRAIVDPYADRLISGEIYGMEVLRRPGASAHDWFAGVRVPRGQVKLFLLPVNTQPDLLDGLPPKLLRRKTGASVFTFTTLDDEDAAAISHLLALAFTAYMATEE